MLLTVSEQNNDESPLFYGRQPKNVPLPESFEDLLAADLVPVAKRQADLFVVYDSKMRVWRGDGKYDYGERLFLEEWSEPEVFPAGFQEQFHAFRNGDDYYFVTRTGKLYHAPKPEKGPRKTVRVPLPKWVADEPIDAVITDVGRDVSYAFAPPSPKIGGGVQGAYCCLDGPPRWQRYDLQGIRIDKADGGWKRVLERAQFLIQHGDITMPKP